MALPTTSGEFGVVAVRDLEFRPNGDAVLNMRLGADDSKYDRQTQKRTEPTKRIFVDVTLWRGDAEAVAEMSLQPGQKVTVSGPMYIREYRKQDGTPGQSATLDAYAFGIRPRPVSQAGNQQGGQQNQQAPQQANPWNNQPPQQNQQAPQQGGGYQQAPAQGYPQQNQQNQQMPPQQNQQGGGWPQGGSDQPPF